MSNAKVSMTAVIEFKGKDTNQDDQLIAKLVGNKKQTQNAILYEYCKDGSDYYLYERYEHSVR